MKVKEGAALLAAVLMAAGSYADMFGSGANQFSIDFVNIGNANNAADTSGYGSVAYDYRMGAYEVTLDQFAKARAADSRIGSGDEGYWNDGTRTVGTAAPASYVSAYEAMKFCNWLTTGDAYTGAYQFDGSGTLIGVDRDTALLTYNKVYVLPTEDEWHKAAYYKPDASGYSLYANGSDNVADLVHGTASGWNYYNSGYVNGSPNYTWETGFGAQEQNGTYDMMGNVYEWCESAYDGTLDNMSEQRVLYGGAVYSPESAMRSSGRWGVNPAAQGDDIGFRVAAIPEPAVATLICMFGGGLLLVRRIFGK